MAPFPARFSLHRCLLSVSLVQCWAGVPVYLVATLLGFPPGFHGQPKVGPRELDHASFFANDLMLHL